MNMQMPLLLSLALRGAAKPFCRDGSTLLQHWQSYNGARGLDRWLEYANAYSHHIPSPLGRTSTVRMLEVGVQSGGSAVAWKTCYGTLLRYVGVDIDPRCARSRNESAGVFVEIGSVFDNAFLKEVCRRHGPFDVIIDDGGHTAAMVKATISALFDDDSCMAPHSVYVVEDLMVMARCGGDKSYCEAPSDFTKLPSSAFESMHDYWFKTRDTTQPAPSIFGGSLHAIHLYDSIAFYVRRAPQSRLTRIKLGTDWFPNEEAKLNRVDTYAAAAAPGTAAPSETE